MTYKAKNPLLPTIVLLIITISSISKTNPLTPWWMHIFSFILLLLTLSSFFITYTVKIDKDKLEYTVSFHKLPIYKRCVLANQILEIKFKRYGWHTKGVVVKTVRKMNIRIIDFYPKEIYKELIDFASSNNLKASKTKDYEILEK